MRRSRLWQLSLAFLLLAQTATCSKGGGSDVTVPVTLVLVILSGNGQTGTVGQAVASAPAVKVTNSAGVAQAGISVTFSITSGSGSVTGATQTTGADGTAHVGSWTLGNVAGANSLSAAVTNATGSPVSFTATGTPGPAATLAKVAGDALTGPAGIAVTTKPSLKATDSFGNAVSGIGVTFAVASGGGSVTGATQTTGADGTATVGGWTLGSLVGTNTLTATVTGTGISNNVVTFTVTGAVGPVASLTKVAGDNLSALVGALLATPPAARAADQFGNFIAGQGVAFAVASGGGSATGTAATTAANGVATVGGWTLGATPGANTMTATASTYTVTFTATALASFNAAQYAGTYTGTWTNTTYGSTGTGNALVFVNTGASTATVTVNVTGQVLGVGGVVNSVNPGAYTNNGATFTGNVAPMGNITATLTTDGHITASGTNLPNTGLTGWTATGTLTANALNLTFTVGVVGGGTAVGTITLAK